MRAYPRAAALHNNLAVVLERRGRYEEAAAAAERAVTEDPAQAPAHKNAGDLHYRAGRYDEALECYLRAVRLDPNLGGDVYLKLGNIRYRRRERDEAVAVLGAFAGARARQSDGAEQPRDGAAARMSARPVTPPAVEVVEIVVEHRRLRGRQWRRRACHRRPRIVRRRGAARPVDADRRSRAHPVAVGRLSGPPSIHPAKYADTGVAAAARRDAPPRRQRNRMVARLAGGARMFAALLSSGINMGQRNIDATRAAL